MLTAGAAYYNQRLSVGAMRERIVALHEAVGSPVDLSLPQWAQITALALEFGADTILELGRGFGNSTCLFTEVANHRIKDGRKCRVLSLCLSDAWETVTLPRVGPLVPERWLDPLDARTDDIMSFDYGPFLTAATRCLVFWDAHGYAIAECVLGKILPCIADRPHVVVMHDLSDARYLPPNETAYGDRGLWAGQNSGATRIRLGHIDSAVEQAVSIVDFSSRNDLPLHSADHSLQTEIGGDARRTAEMRSVLGDLFALQAHWFWFSLEEAGRRPITYPRFRGGGLLRPSVGRAWSRVVHRLSAAVRDLRGG